MQYSNFCGEKVSLLGLGTMRLPVIDGDDSRIDIPKANEIIEYAYNQGVNYFDTAYMYHGGNSQDVVSACLKQFPRESYFLTNKWPGPMLDSFNHIEEIFEDQIKRCEVDYFDFYLIHNVNEENYDFYMDSENYGVVEYLVKQKEAGRIKHLGFSAHATLPYIKKFVAKYGEHLEFCQLQVNWFDWEFQNAKQKVTFAQRAGLPVIVMEPLRGGNLVAFSAEEQAQLMAVNANYEKVEWSYAFLRGIEQVGIVLSGSSSMDQIKQNVALFDALKPSTPSENAVLFEIAKARLASGTLPCTSCKYCLSGCSQELNIPEIIRNYNEEVINPGNWFSACGIRALGEGKGPEACVGCKSCEVLCPQRLPIADTMAKYAAMINQ